MFCFQVEKQLFINYLSGTFSKDCEKATGLCFWLFTYLAPYFLTVKNCYHQFKSKNQLLEKNFSLVFRAVYIDEYQVQNSKHDLLCDNC